MAFVEDKYDPVNDQLVLLSEGTYIFQNDADTMSILNYSKRFRTKVFSQAGGCNMLISVKEAIYLVLPKAATYSFLRLGVNSGWRFKVIS